MRPVDWIRIIDRTPDDPRPKECRSDHLCDDAVERIRFTWIATYRDGKWSHEFPQYPITHWRDTEDY